VKPGERAHHHPASAHREHAELQPLAAGQQRDHRQQATGHRPDLNALSYAPARSGFSARILDREPSTNVQLRTLPAPRQFIDIVSPGDDVPEPSIVSLAGAKYVRRRRWRRPLRAVPVASRS
jgi:hypothetical protein